MGTFGSGCGLPRALPVRAGVPLARSQKLCPQKDGSLVVQFRLSDTEEIKRWIMSFGSMPVLEPVSLCQEIRDELRTLEALYDQQDGQADKTRPVGMKQSRSLR